jgi:diguanylate cyclase (GGDEF)-like protein
MHVEEPVQISAILALGAVRSTLHAALANLVRNAAALLGLSSIALVWALALHTIGVERDQALANAAQETANLSRAFEEHIARSINAADQTLLYMRDSFQSDPVGFDLAGWTRRTQAMTDMTFQIGIIGADGYLLASNVSPAGTRLDLSDREHFRVHRDTSIDRLFISKPTLGRTTQRWSIQLTRRLTGRDGRFAGVIVASMDPHYLTRFRGTVDLGPHGLVRVVGTDGTLRARATAREMAGDLSAGVAGAVESVSDPEIGRSMFGSRLMAAFLAQAVGSYSAAGGGDGVRRINSYREVSGLPLLVSVGRAEDDVLVPFQAKRRGYIALASTLTALLLLVTALVTLRQRRLNRALEQLQANAHILQTTLENISQGIMMVDAQGQVQVCNRRAIETLGLPEALMVSHPRFADVLRFQEDSGEFGPDLSLLDGAVRNLVRTRTPSRRMQSYERQRPNGAILSITALPLPTGGAVTTYTDVTAMREREAALRAALQGRDRAEAALRQQSTRFGAALNNMSQGLCMVDAMARPIVCNARFAEIFGIARSDVEQAAHYTMVFDQVLQSASCDAGLVASIVEHQDLLLGSGTAGEFVSRGGGRAIRVVHQPTAEGGWLATYSDVTEMHRAEEKLSHMAHHDALTDLPNRVLFKQQLDLALAAQIDSGESFALLYLDLDHFKDVNDTMGHQVGDMLLREVSERLKSCVRATDVVARIGGDEFAILQIGAHDRELGTALAQRIIGQMAAPFILGGRVVNIGTSVGLAVAPSDGRDADTLMKSADLALYRAKADGRGTHRFFDTEMDRVLRENHEIETELRDALARGETVLHYQPQVNLATGRITGCEALMRWTSDKLGPIPPTKFIPLAEKIGIIAGLGEWALHEACRTAATWPSDVRVAVNLSPAQFRLGDVVGMVASALAKFGLPAHRLELEITETVLLQDSAAVMATLHGLRDLGVRISLDDFGTGYSSPSYLVRFPFDKVKIDRSFVSGAGIDPRSMAIVRSITALAMELGITTTAEGVETESQREQMRAAHCTDIQGYLVSRPVPADQIAAMLRAETRAVA